MNVHLQILLYQKKYNNNNILVDTKSIFIIVLRNKIKDTILFNIFTTPV